MDPILLGIDVGGSSIKGGLVNLATGKLVSELKHVETPSPSAPAAVIKSVGVLASQLPSEGPVGFAFPAVVKNGVARSAANVDRGWIGADGARLVQETLGRPGLFLNDADAAGIAEITWGAGRGTQGIVIMVTFGTGIGTAIFNDGVLLPNTELGHLELRGGDAEHWASARVRTAENLDFPAWITRVNEYLGHLHALFWPDVFILGGAVSERYDEFAPLLHSHAEIRPAQFGNQSGVIGAALAAAKLLKP